MKYQGKEFRTYIQANSEEALDEMIGQTQKYSKRVRTGPIRLLEKRHDPDGGWEATIVAHNWNPIRWIKEKFGGKREGEEPELSYEEKLDIGEEEELLKVRKEQLEEEKAVREAEEKVEEAEESEEIKPDEKESSEKEELRRLTGKLGELEKATAIVEAEAKLAELEAAKEKWTKLPEDVEATRQELARKREEEKKKLKREGRERVAKKALATYKAVLGPTRPVSKHFYIPRQMPEYYVPGRAVRKLTTPPRQESPIGQVSTPNLVGLRRASSPPPATAIRVPFKDVERQEGLGPAFSRLRQMGKFPKVDWAVYSEVHANGDIDTPSHIRSEVGQLGFSRREIDDSLKRLRHLGLIVPTGQVYNGEKELMVVGETNGHK